MQSIDGAAVTVTGNGGKFEATVVSDAFRDLTSVQRHQKVYAAVNPYIADGTVHALSIRAYTTEEFTRQSG